MSGGVLLLYVDAKSVECNEAYETFSAACLEGDDGSDTLPFMHEVERLVDSFQRKRMGDHRVDFDLAI
jgi:hypothetical protein